jgi:hypothetical protein
LRTGAPPSPEASAAAAGGAASEHLERLWWALLRREWTSLVLVPAQAGSSTADLAAAFARAGSRLGHGDVGAVAVARLDEAAALELENALAAAGRERRAGPGSAGPEVIDVTPPRPGASPGQLAFTRLQELLPRGVGDRLVIAIPPVIEEPRGIAVARLADMVVLCYRLGHTLIADVSRTADLIGRDQIAGCVDMVTP